MPSNECPASARNFKEEPRRRFLVTLYWMAFTQGRKPCRILFTHKNGDRMISARFL